MDMYIQWICSFVIYLPDGKDWVYDDKVFGEMFYLIKILFILGKKKIYYLVDAGY